MGNLLLVDGDMIAYRAAASCEPTKDKPEREPLESAIFRANDLLYRINNTVASEGYRIFLSGSRNFRKILYPEYKANRDGIPKPEYLDTIRELLVREWEAEICDGYEADDGIGIAHNENTIIVSNDKDFKQLSGEHYNPVKKVDGVTTDEFEVVSSEEAAGYFYTQMLVGDASDNIRGVDGIGKVRAGRLLLGKSPEEMHSIVYDLYGDPKRFFLNHRLLSILRSIEEYEEIMQEIENQKFQREAEAVYQDVSLETREPTEESGESKTLEATEPRES